MLSSTVVSARQEWHKRELGHTPKSPNPENRTDRWIVYFSIQSLSTQYQLQHITVYAISPHQSPTP